MLGVWGGSQGWGRGVGGSLQGFGGVLRVWGAVCRAWHGCGALGGLTGLGERVSGAWGLPGVQGSLQGWAWGVRRVSGVKEVPWGGVGCQGLWGGDPAGSLPQFGAPVVTGLGPGSSHPAVGAGAGAQRAKRVPSPSGLSLTFCLSLQVAGVSPGRHLVPAEASCRAKDRLLWLLLGPEHQPQVPAGAADCGGYLGEGQSLADEGRQGGCGHLQAGSKSLQPSSCRAAP